MRGIRPILKRSIASIAALVVALIIPATALAATLSQNAALSQGFTIQGSSSNYVPGAMVSTTTTGSHEIQLANLQSASRLIGVVASNPLIQLSQKGDSVQVVINGTANVFVSDFNGPVKAGQKITASPIDGVGMLATSSTQIIGTVLSNFKSSGSITRIITDGSIKNDVVHIEQLPVQINVSYYQSLSSSVLPPFIQDLANSIAGKSVSVIRVMIGSIILLVAFISIFALLYTATRSGITSIGRNPLSANAITRNLRSVGVVTILVLVASLGAVYLVLTA